MRESCLYGSARGVLGNRHSYRNCSDNTLAIHRFERQTIQQQNIVLKTSIL